MRILPFSDSALAEAVAVIRSGGVVAHATETCYGLACDLTNKAAVEKVFAIKQRSHTQPISGLFRSVEDARAYAEWNAQAEELAAQLPGPLTIILTLKPSSPLLPTPEGGATIGVRVSSHPHAQALADAAGCVLSTTSANIHGRSNPYSVADLTAQFGDAEVQPDLILDSGVLPQNPPSRVIDVASGSVLRP